MESRKRSADFKIKADEIEQEISCSNVELQPQIIANISEIPPEILYMILQMLSTDDMKTARLVCKRWNEELCHLLKDNVITNIGGSARQFTRRVEHTIQELESLLASINPDFPTLIQQIRLRIILDTDAKEINDFFHRHPEIIPRVKELHFDDAPGRLTQNPSLAKSELSSYLKICSQHGQLLRKCARYLRHLYVDGRILHFAFRADSQEDLVCPELQNLSVSLRDYSALLCKRPEEMSETQVEGNLKFTERMLMATERILQTSRKLRKFNLNYKLENPIGSYEKEKLLSFCPQLQRLTVPNCLSAYQILSQSQIPPIKYLSLIQSGKLSQEQTYQMLEGLANSLEFLDIRHLRSMKFLPILPKLKIFETGAIHLCNYGWFNEKLPALEELRVFSLGLHATLESREILPHPILRKMMVGRVRFNKACVRLPGQIGAFRKAFPNLMSFTIVHGSFLELVMSQANQSLADQERLVVEELSYFVGQVNWDLLLHDIFTRMNGLPGFRGLRRLNVESQSFVFTKEQLQSVFPDLEIANVWNRNKEKYHTEKFCSRKRLHRFDLAATIVLQDVA